MSDAYSVPTFPLGAVQGSVGNNEQVIDDRGRFMRESRDTKARGDGNLAGAGGGCGLVRSAGSTG